MHACLIEIEGSAAEIRSMRIALVAGSDTNTPKYASRQRKAARRKARTHFLDYQMPNRNALLEPLGRPFENRTPRWQQKDFPPWPHKYPGTITVASRM